MMLFYITIYVMWPSLLRNLWHVFRSRAALVSGGLTFVLSVLIWRYFIDLDLTIGNMGHTIAYTEVFLYMLFAVLFSLFVAVSVYKYRYFKKLQTKQMSAGSLGWLAWLLVAGCPACSITLASRLWLSTVIWFLPFDGMELKLIAILILGYTLFVLLRDLEVCSRSMHTPFIFSFVTMQKFLVSLTLVAWVLVCGWALWWYAEEQWLLPSSLSPSLVVENTVEPVQVVVEDTYVPSSAPTGACGGADGGCGCGGTVDAAGWGCGGGCWWAQADKPGGCGCGKLQ